MPYLRAGSGRDTSRSGSRRCGAGTALRHRARARRKLCERRAGPAGDVRDRRAGTRGLGAGRAVHRDVRARARASTRTLRGSLRPRARPARGFGPGDGSYGAVGAPTSRHTSRRPAPSRVFESRTRNGLRSESPSASDLLCRSRVSGARAFAQLGPDATQPQLRAIQRPGDRR
jgi:hypothetical protein